MPNPAETPFTVEREEAPVMGGWINFASPFRGTGPEPERTTNASKSPLRKTTQFLPFSLKTYRFYRDFE